jgi:hypothetical protein
MQISAHTAGYDRRGDFRTRIARPAVLRVADKALHIRVEDLTPDGCKIATDAALEMGSTVTLGFSGIGHTSAQVTWRGQDGYGCVFDKRLPAGAVTAATRNNVNHFSGPDLIAWPVQTSDVKWRSRNRIIFIVGATVMLWSMIITGAVLLF